MAVTGPRRSLTHASKSCRLTAIIGEEDQHGLFALVMVAPRSESDQLLVHLVSPQGPHHDVEPQVAAFI